MLFKLGAYPGAFEIFQIYMSNMEEIVRVLLVDDDLEHIAHT